VRFLVGVEEIGDGSVEVAGHLMIAHGRIENDVVDGRVEPALDGIVCVVPDLIIRAR